MSQDCPDFGSSGLPFSPFAPGQNGSSLTHCTFNGPQCCSQFTITLFVGGLNRGINNYAPNFLSGFGTAQEVIDELRSINKAIIPHIAEDIMRPLLLSAVSSPSPHFTMAVNNIMTDIVNTLNGSTVNLTVTFYEYVKVVAFYQFNETVNFLSTETNINDSLRYCINQAIHDHVYNEIDSAVELIELFQNISAIIKILKQLPPLFDKLLGNFTSVKFTDTCLDVFSSNFLCPLCRNQPLMCPGRCKEIITGCASPLNQAIVQLDASFRLILSIAKGLIGSSSSVTNSVNASRIPALYGSLIATVTEYIYLDSGFQKALNSCGIAIQSPSPLGKRNLNEQVTVERKRAVNVPDVGINASFFEEFERKLNLLGGSIINTVKEKFCNPTFSIQYSGLTLQITAENGMCSYGAGNVGTYNSTFEQEDITAQAFNNPAGRYNYTQLLNQARSQTYVITELFNNSDISPTVFNIFLPNEAIPTTDFLSVTVPIDLSSPQIYVHPSDKIVKVDNDSTNVTFICMAYGASSYYWLRETDDHDIPSNAAGINSSSLTLHNVLPPDSGRYQCVAENVHGKTYSNYAMLTVEALHPVVSIAGSNIVWDYQSEKELQVRKGDHVEFICSATGVGADDFIYQWFLNDLPVAGEDTSILVINIVSENNTGDYKCFVRNQYSGIGESEVIKVILVQFCNPVTVDYNGFNITWNETQSGITVETLCTGDGLNGIVRRRCINDDLWEEMFECFKEETRKLLDQAKNLTLSINELNETQTIAKASGIANSLVNITAPTQEPILAQDINLAVNIISTLNNVTETVVANLTVNDTFFEDTTSVIDNLLSDTNRDSWRQLERTSPSTSQNLISGAEQVTKLLGQTLTNDTTEAIKIRPNIVIKAERVSNDSVYRGYIFPDEDDNLTAYAGGNAQLMISSRLLQNITAGSEELTIASTVIRNNSGIRLPSSNEGTLVPQVPASPIFSLQINPPPDLSALVDNPIMMVFDVDPIAALSEQSDVQNEQLQDITVDDVSCNFYDYTLVTNSNLNQIGGWSTEGLTLDINHSNKTLVTCLTTHLTSFAVLVSIQDERPPSTADKALSIISYIGCSVSLVCLCASIIFLSYTIYKTKDKRNHLFIHLNLCIALALGLVVFIAGIENASSNEGGCKYVAALLQYLFISAFCWMLCEGVFLYMMLITVLGNKLNNRRFFFVLGWGPAIPIVAISAGIAHEHYGTDHYCWIKSDDGAIAAFIVPIVAIMLINCAFLAITLKVLWQQKMSEQVPSNRDTVKSLLRAVLILLPLLGMTWIIGIFAINNETQVFAWIFAILNSLQGVFIFILHVIKNKQVAREVRERYNFMRKSKMIRRLLSDHGSGTTSTSGIQSKARTSQSTLSEISDHNKKISTTFGSSGTGGDYPAKTLQISLEDKPGVYEDNVEDQIKLTTLKELEQSMIEEHHAGVENEDDEEKKSITEEDSVAILAERDNTAATVKE